MMKFVFDPATYLKNGGSLSDLSVVVKGCRWQGAQDLCGGRF